MSNVPQVEENERPGGGTEWTESMSLPEKCCSPRPMSIARTDADDLLLLRLLV
jgi:hypothetical protein